MAGASHATSVSEGSHRPTAAGAPMAQAAQPRGPLFYLPGKENPFSEGRLLPDRGSEFKSLHQED